MEDAEDFTITGWLICRLPEDEGDDTIINNNNNDNNIVNNNGTISSNGEKNNNNKSFDSFDKKPLIHCALYGQFNQSDIPPRKKWVFLGSDVLKNVNLDQDNKLYLKQSVDESSLIEARQDSIRVEVGFNNNDALPKSSSNANLNNNNNNDSNSFVANKTRYYSVRGSSIKDINGRYVYNGMYFGACMYRNVRNWIILRQPLSEIPELGIAKETTYDLSGSKKIMETLYKSAADSNLDLIGGDPKIAHGSHRFKYRFINIARAGNKLTTVDQVLQVDYNNNLKAAIRNRMSEELLLQLQQSKIVSEEDLLHLLDDEQSVESMNSINENVDSPTNNNNSNINVITNSFITNSLITSDSPPPSPLSHSLIEIEKDSKFEQTMRDATYKLDLEVSLGRKINYQVGSQGFLMSSDNKHYLSAESEISIEVNKCIEQREATLIKIKIEFGKLQKQYFELEDTHKIENNKIDDLLNNFYDLINDIRNDTIELSKALGAWARIIHKEGQNKTKRKVKLYNNDDDPRRSRKYCVVTSQRAPFELYPISTAVVAAKKKYSRPMEPAKSSEENKFIGVFETRDEAVMAFEKAFNAIPLEYMLLADKTAESKMIIGLRPCGKHYIVRSNGVPGDLKCEQCALETDYKNSQVIIPNIYPHEILAQYIYKGDNYLDKIWADLDFLEECHLLKKRYPNENMKSNPLLLNESVIGKMLKGIKSKSSSNPLETLKGRIELVEEALYTGTKESIKLREKELNSKNKTNPYNRNMILDLPKDYRDVPKKLNNIKKSNKTIKGNLDTLNMSRTMSAPNNNKEFLFTSTSVPNFTVSSSLPLYDNFLGQFDELNRCLYIIGQTSPQVENLRSILANNDENKIAIPLIENTALDLQETFNTMPASTSNFLNTELIPSSSLNNTFGTTNLNLTDKTIFSKGKSIGKLTMVETFYSYRGVEFSTTQMRKPVAHRVDDMFCRFDEGEFAKMTQGRAMRSYYYKENLEKEGKLKNEERKRLSELLKDAMSVHIVDCNVPYIQKLIERAKILKGSVLNLDVIQAESFIKYFESLVPRVIRVQCQYHGNQARKRVKQIRADIAWRKKRFLIIEKQSSLMAAVVVPQLLQDCIQKEVKNYCKAIFTFSANMSGQYTVVSVFKMVRKSRKPLELCPSCLTIDRAIVKYRPFDRSYNKERAPCCCNLVQNEERWRLRIYNPLDKSTKDQILSTIDVREVLEEIRRSWTLLHPDSVSKLLIGKSMGTLQPLFNAPKDGSIISNMLLAISTLSASLESSVLPLLPKKYSNELSSIIAGEMQEEDSIKDWMKSVRFPQTINKYDGFEVKDDKNISFKWEPLKDLVNAKRHIDRTLRENVIRIERLRDAYNKMNNCQDIEETRREYNEHEGFYFEDKRSVVFNTLYNIDLSDQHIKNIMKFSKELLRKFEEEESNKSENWQQSYDKVEDANGWKGLNSKRKLEKILIVNERDYIDALIKYKPVCDAHIIAKKNLLNAKMNYLQSKRAYENFQKFIAPTYTLQKNVHIKVMEAIKALVKTYSMPRKGKQKANRRIQRMPYHLVFVRDPLERMRKENRNLLTFLDQKAIGLRPINKHTLDKRLKSTVRCVVQVLLDEVTGYYLIHIGQEEIPIEESSQHADFYLEKIDFSDLTFHGLENDIILRPENVVQLLSRPLETNVEKSISYNKSEKFVVPSLRPRTTIGIIPYIRKNAKLKALASTYSDRRKEKEKCEYDIAKQLIDRLRLQPHTGRPCLGILHLFRRIEYTTKQLHKCLWYNDLVNSNPLLNINKLITEYSTISNFIFLTTIFANFRNFELFFVIPHPLSKITISYNFPIQAVIDSLVYQPILLSSFLLEHITNRYSYETRHHLYYQLSLNLPGAADSKSWRKFVRQEIPHPVFKIANNDLYRGPIYSLHRFISGLYFCIQIFVTALEDFWIQLKRPVNGKYWANQYQGDQIDIKLSRDELRAIVAKISINRDIASVDCFRTLKLLHWTRREELFNVLFEILHLTLNKSKETKKDYLITELNINSCQVFNFISLNNLKCELEKVYNKFNLWISNGRSKDFVNSLTKDKFDMMKKSIDFYGEKPNWKIKNEKDKKNRQIVSIYNSYWSFLDLDKYSGTFSESKDFIYREYCSNFNIFVFTNLDKSRLYVTFKKSSLLNDDMQVVASKLESELFAKEDTLSNKVRRSEQKRLDLYKIVDVVEFTTNKIENVLLPKLLSQTKFKISTVKKLRQLLDEVILYFKNSLRLQATTTSNYVFAKIVEKVQSTNIYRQFTIDNNRTLIEDTTKIDLTKIVSLIKLFKKKSKFPKVVTYFIDWINIVVFNISDSYTNINHTKPIVLESVYLKSRLRVNRRYESKLTDISLTTASIPRHANPRYTVNNNNESGFRKASSWRRDFLTNSSKPINISNNKSKPKAQVSSVIRISDREYLRSKTQFYSSGVVIFNVFDILTSETWLIRAIHANNSNLYYKCFNNQDDEAVSSNSDDVQSSLITIMASNFAFKVLVQGFANICINNIEEYFASDKFDLDEEIKETIDHKNYLESFGLVGIQFDNVVDTKLSNTDSSSLLSTIPSRENDTEICALFIPEDQSQSYVDISTSIKYWNTSCFLYLNITDISQFYRNRNLIGMIYTANNNTSIKNNNIRVEYVVKQYYENLGWRSGDEVITMKNRIIRDNRSETYQTSYYGNAILLLRFGKEDKCKVMELLNSMYAEYAPIRAMRLLKEGKEKEWRKSNYSQYRQFVFEIARVFSKGFELLYNCHHRSKDLATSRFDTLNTLWSNEELLVLETRLLFTKFYQLVGDNEVDMDIISSLDLSYCQEALLLDTSLVYDDETVLLRFDSLLDDCFYKTNIRHFFRKYLRESEKEKIELSSSNAQVTVGQVVYALYQTHCLNCDLPISMCKIPGCCIIRDKLKALDEYDNQVGSGLTKGEQFIKDYIFNGKHHFDPFPVVSVPPEIDLEEEKVKEDTIDYNALKKHNEDEAAKFNWFDICEEAKELKYINQMMIRPSLSESITALDIRKAKGTFHGQQAESLMASFVEKDSNDIIVKKITDKSQESDNKSLVLNSTNVDEDDILSSDFNEIPMGFVKEKLGLFGEILPPSALDPYSSKSLHHERFPMSSELFSWLMKSLRLTNPNKLPFVKSLDDECNMSNLVSRFDRLHCERTVCMPDKTFIIIQILHGIIDKASFINDERNGVPECATRLISVNTLKKLKNGLTIVVYDQLSRVSRATSIDENSLYRAAEAFQTTSDNCPFIARKIIENTTKCINIVRVAGFFTDVTFNTSFSTSTKRVNENNDSNGQNKDNHNNNQLINCKYLGRKYLVNKTGPSRRLNAMQSLLNDN